MKNLTNKQIYKRIKNKRITGTVILFLVVAVIAWFAAYYSVKYFFRYIGDSKLAAGKNTAKTMGEIYDEGVEEKDDKIYDILDQFGLDYFLSDKDGKVVFSSGEVTVKGEPKEIELAMSSEKLMIYEDKSIDFLYVEDNVLRVSFTKVYSWMNKMGEEEADRLNEEMENGETTLDIPLWIVVPVNDGRYSLNVKTFIKLSERDVVIFAIIIIALAAFIFTLITIIFIRAISNIVRQRKITNYFFTNVVTGGKNWMWFHIKGEETLRRRKNAKNKYAVVNLSFINYRKYCLCHSVEAGEKLLFKINSVLSESINKKELSAHNNAAEFGLMLQYEDKDEITARIKELIGRLESIETGQKLAFQAGVAVIDVASYLERKQKDDSELIIEDEFNNACAARARLAESDESGVAFFDEKLVEEEKWLDSVQAFQDKAVKNEEFQVYYQPKYDPKTDELRGAEALIRWQSPELGFVSPGKFIPIFEKNGFITEIDHYMLSHVAKDQKRWLDQGYKCVPVSVNISRAHFVEEDLAEQIRDMVDAAGTPHEYIEIELTESAFFDDKKAMINTINKLKGYGFAVSMDDFGSGYSSLNSLKDMPLDVLKLDAEFFRGDQQGDRGAIVVSEAIRLAKSLNMRTVAEGVEVKEQVNFLAGEGCDMIQGYYYAKPMPGADYEERMRTGVKHVEDNTEEKPEEKAKEKTASV